MENNDATEEQMIWEYARGIPDVIIVGVEGNYVPEPELAEVEENIDAEGYYRDLDGGVVNPRLGQQIILRTAAYEEAGVDSPDRTDFDDMPKLAPYDINEGEGSVQVNDTDEDDEEDIETYEEDHIDHEKPNLWLNTRG